MKLKRCPKCRSVDVRWREALENYTFFQQTKDGIAVDGVHVPGIIFKVEGWCCRCGHWWRPRDKQGRPAVQMWCLPGGIDRNPEVLS